MNEINFLIKSIEKQKRNLIKPHIIKDENLAKVSISEKEDFTKVHLSNNEMLENVRTSDVENYTKLYIKSNHFGEKSEVLKKTLFSNGEELIQGSGIITGQNEHSQKESDPGWDIAALETFFAKIKPQNEPIQINQCSTISNVSQFIENHIATVKRNKGKQSFLPYLHRLQEARKILSIKSN